MKTNVNKFRVKGGQILKKEPTRPQSINSFLNDQNDIQSPTITQKHKTPEPQKHNGARPQTHKDPVRQKPGSGVPEDAVERIHVQIRKDLADKLIHLVYSRKLSKKASSQRSVIEQALEEFFDRHNS